MFEDDIDSIRSLVALPSSFYYVRKNIFGI